MKKSLVLLFWIALTCSVVDAQTEGSSDREAIKLISLSFQDAWNSHNIKGLAALVADDVDFINVAGQWMKNRKEFEESHARSHQMQAKQSVLTIKDTHIKFVSPKVAIVHVEWSMKGDTDPDGKPRQPRQGILTWVVEKQKRKWLIIASHNTNSIESGLSK